MKNRKLFVSILAGLLALVMVLGIVAMVVPVTQAAESSASIQKRLDALKEDKKAIDAEIAAIDADIDENFTEIEKIVAEKNKVDQEIFLLTQQVTNINGQIAEYSLLVADKQDELDAAEEELSTLQAENKARIRAMEKNGKISYWSVLFKANSFTDLLDRLEMISQIAEADEKRLQELADAADAVEAAKAELETEVAALEDTKDELADSQATLEEKSAESDALLAELVARGQEFEALMDAAEEEMAELKDDISDAEKDLKEAQRQEWLAANPNYGTGSTTPSTSAPSSKGWIKPCRYSAVTSAFGYRIHPIYGDRRLHKGVDLGASKGTPIYASKSGTVSTASYDGSRGYYVRIDHGDGFKSEYLHMTHYIVKSGQQVTQGQVIGYVGSTGASTGPHLHFGISYNGNYVNPANYVSL